MSKVLLRENLLIDGPDGVLEALLERPQDNAISGVAIVCHPHPVYGGTMQNKVVHTLARAFLTQRMAALRFNFRGVGKSAGTFDDGAGELLDTLAVIEWVRERYPEESLWLAGFSFGGAMAVHAATKTSPAGLVSIAPAIYRFAGDGRSRPVCPWLIVQGDQDELVNIDETLKYVNGLSPRPELEVVSGGTHFFHGRLVELRRIVEGFIGDHAS